MTTFDCIAEECSCPVKKIDGFSSRGCYYAARHRGDKSRIEVYSTGDNAENIATLLHEQAHHQHELDGCVCIELRNQSMAEYHAYRDSLKAAIQLNRIDVVIKVIDLIREQSELKRIRNPHRTAARKVMKLKLWNKALDLTS